MLRPMAIGCTEMPSLVGAQPIILYFDHTFWLNYADASLFNLGYQFRIENPDAFWAGLNLNSSLNFGLETGVILDGSWANADQFRIGALATYNVGATGSNQGFSLAVNFELVKSFSKSGGVKEWRRNLLNSLTQNLLDYSSRYASIGRQVQIRFRSPCALFTRAIAGQNLNPSFK